MNTKTILGFLVIIITLSALFYFFFTSRSTAPGVVTTPITTTISYKNPEYGFNFKLPISWQGYSIVTSSWNGTPLTSTTTVQSGPKLVIRNPKWTTSVPYEDLPILVFTISQWNAYMKESFTISAAPLQATELGRNNVYVFALPARWDFDYSLNFKEAEDIIASKPLSTFNIGVSNNPAGKLNTDLICERVLTYMTFIDSKSANIFVTDCKNGKHPEVIEKYKADMNLGTGATI